MTNYKNNQENNTPFFSIVVPTYNRADFIPLTLQSIEAQTFTDYEVIIIDDASTDQTAQAVAPYINNAKIHYIRLPENRERGNARNVGAKNAKGNYITYLDSDDLLYPDSLAEAYEYAQKKPQIKLFHHLYHLINEEGKVIRKYDFPSLKNPLKAIAKGNFLSCIGVFLHKDVYQQIFWDENRLLSGSEDYDYWLRVIGYTQTIGRIEKVLGAIRHHDQRSVQTQEYEKVRQRFLYFFEKIDQHPQYQIYKPYQHRIKSTLWLFLALTAWENQQPLMAQQCLQEAKKIDKSVWTKKNFWSLWLKSKQL
ncbi:MAG: glycosyltransferase family 2 protein [Cytophagales bacterium]|nr:MAG: glycosyltransferase family 2 protein [Cytophagales bacterium]